MKKWCSQFVQLSPGRARSQITILSPLSQRKVLMHVLDKAHRKAQKTDLFTTANVWFDRLDSKPPIMTFKNALLVSADDHGHRVIYFRAS